MLCEKDLFSIRIKQDKKGDGMKRIIIAVFLLCFLSGCKSTRSVIAENGRFLVSAVGFDRKEDSVLASVEAIVVNSGDSEQPPTATVFEGTGKTPVSALEDAVKKSIKPLDFGHCAMVVLSDNLTDTTINQIYKYCLDNNEITVSVGFAKTDSANKLLKLKPTSDIAIGYEMAVMLETQYTENDIRFNNRFYELENARIKGEKEADLPLFQVNNENFYLVGE